MANKRVKLLIAINDSLPVGKVLSLPAELVNRMISNGEVELVNDEEQETEQPRKYTRKVQKD
jgi:hypothetical protein